MTSKYRSWKLNVSGHNLFGDYIIDSLLAAVDESQLDEWRKKLENIIDDNLWQQIATLAASKYDASSEQQVDINVESLDKEQRTQIHQLIKQLYKNKLISKTCDQPEEQQVPAKKVIRISKPKPGRCK